MNQAIINLLDQVHYGAYLDFFENDNSEHLTQAKIDELINQFEAILNIDPANKCSQLGDEIRVAEYDCTFGYGCGYTFDALSILPGLYIRKREYRKAEKAALRAISLAKRIKKAKGINAVFHNQSQADNYFLLGWVYYFLGSIDKALCNFNRSIEIREGYISYFGICLCHKKRRDLREARINLNMARMLKALHSARFKTI